MSATTLYVGNRNYSSWSLRASLVVRQSGIECTEAVIPLDTEEGRAKLKEVSPSRRVPVLYHDELVIWDSLAIAEYLHEREPAAGLWPADATLRAIARSVSAEMHSGFAALRNRMPMDLRGRHTVTAGPDVRADIARVETIWNDCRSRYGAGGDYLFGAWCVADAMFAPVVGRFRSYGVVLGAVAEQYADAVWRWPAMASLVAEAEGEPWILELGL
jgi:glutathione S-transferase